jgi:ABC-type transporter Mla MlaB component
MNKSVVCTGLICLILFVQCTKNDRVLTETESNLWPDSISWWKQNNLRVIQANLPAYEGGLNADSLVADLLYFSANTLIINAGGIMAFYPTQLDCQYTNPFMTPGMLGDVIRKCHENDIRVIARFDFSRAHKSIFDKHPDWFYLSPKGERIINDDMYVVSINAPYEQDCLFNIVDEVITHFPVDGIFINMPGYQTRNAYLGVYHGIDQNPYDAKRFKDFSGGLNLPSEENPKDPVYKKYQEFKQYTINDLMQRLNTLVKSKNEQIAICTYLDEYVDIIRHESQTNTLPYWPYNASDNVSNTMHSFPNHIVSNASIQQISFQSRYNAIEPEEIAIRLYENIANGSGLDLSLMGDFQDYEDERNYQVIHDVYAYHKKHQAYFGKYQSPAQVAVLSPSNWPSGDAAQEYRGIQLMLKEAHIQYDIIQSNRLAALKNRLQQYRLIILPGVSEMDSASLSVLKELVANGTNLLATNRTLINHPDALQELFGAKPVNQINDGSGYYLSPDNETVFTRLKGQKLIHVKFNLGLNEYDKSNTQLLPVLTPGRPGPPEIIGGHEPTGHFAVSIKKNAKSQAVYLPVNIGKLYYLHGYEQHKNIVLDLIDYVAPEVNELIDTNAPPRVEVVLQKYIKNIPANIGNTEPEGLALHLINLTGFSGNTYFNPLAVHELHFTLACEKKPTSVFSLKHNKNLEFTWKDGRLELTVEKLEQADGIIIDW